SPNEAEHGDMQDTGKHPSHKGSGDADQNIGEDAVIGCGHLFCNPSGDCANHQHRKETNSRVAEKSLRVFHLTLQHITLLRHPRYWSNEAKPRVAKKLLIQPEQSSKGLGVPHGYPPRLFSERPKWQLPIWHPPGLRRPSRVRAGSPGWSSG